MSEEQNQGTTEEAAELTPEAQKMVAAAYAARKHLERAATACDVLELEGMAKQFREQAAKMAKRGQTMAKRVTKEGTQAERAEAKKTKKVDKIAKLKAQLAKLTA